MHPRGGVVGIEVFVRCTSKFPDTVSGDAFWYAEDGPRLWAAVIDGLGFGVPAAEAARLAVACLAQDLQEGVGAAASTDADHALTVMMQNCDARLHHTRGAALGLALFDMERGEGRYAGVGNVELRVLNANHHSHPVCLNGIVGAGLRKVRVEKFSYAPGSLILMHSDGLSSHFDLEASQYTGRPLEEIGEHLIAAHSKKDDMTLLLMRQHA